MGAAVDTLLSVRVFLAVANERSFAQAAARLSLSRAVVSKHVKYLEAHIGTRLLDRTTRSVRLTELGREFFLRAQQSVSELHETMAQAGEATKAPRGRIRVTCALSFGLRHLSALVSEFVGRFPEVSIELDLSDRIADLASGGYDLAIRVAALDTGSLIARKLAITPMLACASPAYLSRHGTPRTPADLAGHNCLTYSYSQQPNLWSFAHGIEREAVRVHGCLQVNNGDMLQQLALDGRGIALLPAFLVRSEIAAGRLISLLPGYDAGVLGIHAVYAHRKFMPAKVRAFLDFLVERFGSALPPGATPVLSAGPAVEAARAAIS